MFSSPSRRQALLSSLCLTVFAQQPVMPADCTKIASAVVPQPHSLIAHARISPLSTVATTSETNTVYDADTKTWMRWFLVSHNDGSRASIRVATSTDGHAWKQQPEVCLESGAGDDAWDFNIIDTPYVVLNPNAHPSRKFMMWYSGSNDRRHSLSGMPETSLGLAFSADGRTFRKLPADESPYTREGMVLAARETFPARTDVVDGCVGQPSIVYRDGKFAMSFYNIGNGANGEIAGAGIGKAISNDGINWSIATSAPVTVQVVGERTTTHALVGRLKQLATAYSEASM